MKSWFAEEWNKEVYTVGPLVPSKPTTYMIAAPEKSSLSSDIEAFLDKSLKEYGEKSLVLVTSINKFVAVSLITYLRALRSHLALYSGP